MIWTVVDRLVIPALKSDVHLALARELGLADLTIALIGMARHVWPSWRIPGPQSSVLFYALLIINHAFGAHRRHQQSIALTSDLGVTIFPLKILWLQRVPSI